MRAIIAFAVCAALSGAAGFAHAQIATRGALPPQSDDFKNRYRSGVDSHSGGFSGRGGADPMDIVNGRALVASSGAPCSVTDVRAIDRGRAMGGRGAPTYEVACKEGMGWIVSQAKSSATANDCMALAASAAALPAGRQKSALTCKLKGADDVAAAMQPTVDKAGIKGCKVTDARWLGEGGDPKISRYEVLCDSGAGYLVDAPALGSKAKLDSMTCAVAKASGAPCSLKKKA